MSIDLLAATWTVAIVVGVIVAAWLLAVIVFALIQARRVRLDEATEIRLVQMEASWRLHELSRNAFDAMLDTARHAQVPKE